MPFIWTDGHSSIRPGDGQSPPSSTHDRRCQERADIVDVVGEHVVLKKKGREFVALPFHDTTSHL